MNFTQMKYFITAAKCKNFTKAADKLFVTQPALSRQISCIEKELNIQLFIRNNRSVKLTPSAVILLEEFEKIYHDYNLAVAKATNSFAGLSGELNVGILEGAYVGDLLPGVLQHFDQYYPNVKINLRNYSFNELIENLYSGANDLIITLLFDVKDRQKLQYEILEPTRDHIVVHKDHRLANAKYVKLSDFKDDTFIMVSTEDSETSPRLILDAFKGCEVTPRVKFATNLQEEMLWVEAGVGVCMLDSRNALRQSKTVKFLDVDQVSDPSLTLAWNVDNYNPMKDIFRDILLDIGSRKDED